MGCLWAKRAERFDKLLLCVFFGQCEKKNSKAFGDKRQFDQGLKQDFLCNPWVWSNLFIVPRVHSIIDFMDWIGIS